MKKKVSLLFVFVLLIIAVVPTFAGKPGKGLLYYDGGIVRTVIPPASSPKEGRDNIYAFPNGGAEDQLPVAAVAPGDTDYHGGKWAVHLVDWNVTPYLLTSEGDVQDAADAGDVTITRVPEADFKCPIQPLK